MVCEFNYLPQMHYSHSNLIENWNIYPHFWRLPVLWYPLLKILRYHIVGVLLVLAICDHSENVHNWQSFQKQSEVRLGLLKCSKLYNDLYIRTGPYNFEYAFRSDIVKLPWCVTFVGYFRKVNSFNRWSVLSKSIPSPKPQNEEEKRERLCWKRLCRSSLSNDIIDG